MAKRRKIPHHFDRVASRYNDVRDTDPGVVEPIIDHLPMHDRVLDVIDVGCGTGRYTSLIAQRFDGPLRLLCCDYSAPMLEECRKRMRDRYRSKLIGHCRVSAEDLPFMDESLDGIVTFNAVHHFNLDRFVLAASHALRSRGLLSVYTRTPEQNERTIWGQHFPGFTETETRLYSRERLERAIDSTEGFHVEGIHEFRNERAESIESLVERTRSCHYSTFALYPCDAFDRAVETFVRTLSEISKGGVVEHTAENTLVLARRE